MAERIPGIADGGFVLVVEGGGERGVTHVEGLTEVGGLFKIVDAVVVDVEVQIDEIKCFEDIADTAASILIEGAVEDDIFCLEGIGRGYEPEHAVGDGDPEIMGGIDGVGADDPGIVRRGLSGEGRGQEKSKKENAKKGCVVFLCGHSFEFAIVSVEITHYCLFSRY